MAFDIYLANVSFHENEQLMIVLNSTDALGWLGPVARSCYTASDNSQNMIDAYQARIDSFSAYLGQLRINIENNW